MNKGNIKFFSTFLRSGYKTELELAQDAQVTRQTVAKLKEGGHINLRNLEAIAKTLGCGLDDLWEVEGNHSSNAASSYVAAQKTTPYDEAESFNFSETVKNISNNYEGTNPLIVISKDMLETTNQEPVQELNNDFYGITVEDTLIIGSNKLYSLRPHEANVVIPAEGMAPFHYEFRNVEGNLVVSPRATSTLTFHSKKNGFMVHYENNNVALDTGDIVVYDQDNNFGIINK